MQTWTRAVVLALCVNASSGVENLRDMVVCFWANECACRYSLLDCSLCPVWCPAVRLEDMRLPLGACGGHLPDICSMTKWFYSTRLETRTKESNICASSRVVKPACAMKVTAGIFAPATDQSIVRGLSMSISVRTRKMVNYA